MRRKSMVAVFLFLSAGGLSAFAVFANWKQFTASSGFSVRYPESWFRIGASADRLQILSSRRGAEGVTIKPGEAEITVLQAQTTSHEPLADVVKLYTRDVTVLSREDVIITDGDLGCDALDLVISKEQPIPAADSPIRVPFVINTDYFCAAGGNVFVVLLRNWEGDQHQATYRKTAAKMANSLLRVN